MLLNKGPFRCCFAKATKNAESQQEETVWDKSFKGVPTRNSVVDVGSTKWLALKTIDWTDAKGVERKWDVATRTTKRGMDQADAVFIIPILRSKDTGKKLETVLVQQYRPPTGTYTLEFPAGLIDKGESARDAALRELKEETGFVGTVDEESMILCMSPGLTDEAVKIVVVNVDLDQDENKNPKQMLEEEEDIVIKRVDLVMGLKDLMEKGSGMPISLLYSFALGVELGRREANSEE